MMPYINYLSGITLMYKGEHWDMLSMNFYLVKLGANSSVGFLFILFGLIKDT